eukprot:TRINITY_DN7932_c0_g1_i4.p1 TRINITY_DN7932_c0_g1~~TRINITY_DN7932_c0_g1_i4.p1  ORF type:complete len:1142 (+),score=203.09 TRINITY_DN7932_c0_g1_i4:256-3681(+)
MNYGFEGFVDGDGTDEATAWQTDEQIVYATTEWATIGSQFAAEYPLSAVAFDPYEELLWMGCESGRVGSFSAASLLRYSSVQAHIVPVVKIFPSVDSVMTVSSNEIKFLTRGGVTLSTIINEQMYDVQDACFSNPHEPHLLLAGVTRESMIELDLTTSSIVKETYVDCGIVALEKAQRCTIAGCNDGMIRLYDFRANSYRQQIPMHSGCLQSLAVRGDLVATCGWFYSRQGMVLDNQVNFYDLRMNRLLMGYSDVSTPTSLKFHPTYSAVVIIASNSGNVQFCDIQGAQPVMQENIMIGLPEHGFLTKFDISSSGQCLSVGCGDGSFQVLANKPDYIVNNFQMGEVSFDGVATQYNAPEIQMDLLSPLSTVILPKQGEPLLSDIPAAHFLMLGRKPPKLDTALKSKMKQIDYVGYISNPKVFRRNQLNLNEAPSRITIISTDFTHRRKKKTESHGLNTHGGKAPQKYCFQEVKWTRIGIDGFDFSLYNDTKFGGLENTLPNHYTNAIIQILYFVPCLRQAMINHICQEEFCLACELGFLFHTLDKAMGRNCQSRNFLRALSHLKEAAQSGVLEPVMNNIHLSYQRLIEQFNTFLLLQLNKELSPVQSEASSSDPKHKSHSDSSHQSKKAPASDIRSRTILSECFGFTVETETICRTCQDVERRISQQSTVTLMYSVPAKETTKAADHTFQSFEELLNGSITKKQITNKRHCPKCSSFQPYEQARRLSSIPQIFNINCSIQSREDANLWMDPDLAGASAGRKRAAWPPKSFRVRKLSGSLVDHVIEPDDDTPIGPDCSVFELQSATCYIINTQKREATRSGHIITYINVPEYYTNMHGDPNSQPGWYLFNDFTINSVPEDEVLSFSCAWKIPCILMYHKKGFSQEVAIPTPMSHITAAPLFHPTSLSKRTAKPLSFVPLQATEIPLNNALFGLDAEFVALSEEEVEMDKSGNPIITKPRRQGLGRVSIVRGSGPLAKVPIVDDYIHTSEEVVDYLTKFSGLMPGDLDPSSSIRHITTLKTSYLKIRFLVDNGAKFVGHGLTQDFRILDIHVPPEQIIDTVDLFHLRNQRKISLRFLAYLLLNVVIQHETHDSIEDARTALLLYEKYIELKQEGRFEDKLEEIYTAGREMNWQIPSSQPNALS